MAFRGPLEREKVDRFEGDGYLVIRQLFDPADIVRIRRAFERLETTARRLSDSGMHEGSQFVLEHPNTPNDPDAPTEAVRIKRVVWCGGSEPMLSDLGRSPRLLAIAGQLMGTKVVEQLINQAHFKFPDDEVSFPWHQDSVHRRYGTDLWTDVTGRGSFIEIATAVDPVTPHNGPLKFIPGSHKEGHIDPDPASGALPDGAFDPADAVSPVLDPGDAVVFGPYVIHGSDANRGTHPRRMFLNGFAYPGANRRDYPGVDAGRRLDVPEDVDLPPAP